MPAKNPARQETLAYHQEYYTKHALFDEDSWLARADADMLALAQSKLTDWQAAPLKILDLGCGVGRNAVPLAQLLKANGIKATIDCYDVLDTSINMLKSNSTRYGVDDYLHTRVVDNDELALDPQSYDYILAISVIEHCQDISMVERLLGQLARAVKPGGYCQIEITTDRSLVDRDNGEKLPTSVETPMTKDQVIQLLSKTFVGLEVLKLSHFDYHEDLLKDGRNVHWSSTQTAFLAKRH